MRLCLVLLTIVAYSAIVISAPIRRQLVALEKRQWAQIGARIAGTLAKGASTARSAVSGLRSATRVNAQLKNLRSLKSMQDKLRRVKTGQSAIKTARSGVDAAQTVAKTSKWQKAGTIATTASVATLPLSLMKARPTSETQVSATTKNGDLSDVDSDQEDDRYQQNRKSNGWTPKSIQYYPTTAGNEISQLGAPLYNNYRPPNQVGNQPEYDSYDVLPPTNARKAYQ
jgi:hypothetical protein